MGEVAAVIEMHGYPAIRALSDVKRLQEALHGFLHMDRDEPVAKKGSSS